MSDFPLLDETGWTYLDTAATAQKPMQVVEAIRDFYLHDYGTVHRAVYDLSTHATAKVHQVREQVATFLNARSSDEVIFTRGCTDSINLVAHSFGRRFLNPGDEVLITELEHHSNIVPWQLICEETGAILRVAPINDRGELLLDEFERRMDSKTKIVSLCHIANSIGTLNPIAEVTAIAHAYGAVVLVDGAQAAGHMKVDVQALDADFYTFSGHKIYGPTGIGVLWGKKELLEELPPYQGGGDMIEKVTYEETTYNALPYRFEAGTPHIAGIVGLGAALTYLSAHNPQEREGPLMAQALDLLKGIPDLTLYADRTPRGPIFAFNIAGVHPEDLASYLNLKKIAIRSGHLCAQPTLNRLGVSSMCRVSLGLYNTPEHLDRCAQEIRAALKVLK